MQAGDKLDIGNQFSRKGEIVKKRQYVCDECNRPVIFSGTGLKTTHCPAHPTRFVSVPRDTSGGKEAERNRRKDSVVVSRPTKVRVVYAQ